MKFVNYLFKTALVSAVLFIVTPLWGQLKTGKLSNGFTYYLYSDPSFNKEVSFYLYQNVGAILETDKEQGVAHFLEHLAFNSTTHFPEGVMNFLREKGLQSFHAQTGLNDTRFSFGNIANTDTTLINKLFLVLQDWCSGITFTPQSIEKERGIILEEKRQRNTLDKRLSDAIAPAIYNNSPYAFRNIIGHEKDLRHFSSKVLENFYRTWYRPDLQCLMIVGDFDLDVYQKKVVEIFSSLPLSMSPKMRKQTPIENNSKPLFYKFVDKGNAMNSFGIYQRIPYTKPPKERNLTAEFINTMLFNDLMPKEIARLNNSQEATFIAATVSLSDLVRGYAQMAWDVVPYQGKEKEALEQILSIREKVKTRGVSSKDFDEAVQKAIGNLKQILEGKETLGTANNFVEAFRQNYLYELPIQNFKETLTQNLEYLVDLEVVDFNAWLKTILETEENISFIVYTAQAKSMPLTLKDFEKTLSEVSKNKLSLKTIEPKNIDQLIDFEIKPGTIVDRKNIEDLDAVDWRLSNGGRVIYKYLPKLKDRFYFVGTSLRGRSVVKSEDFSAYVAMRDLIMKTGIGLYNRNDLATWLQGKNIELNITLNDRVDGIGGNAPVEQADNFFSYFYLILTQQQFSPQVFNQYIQKKKYLWSMRDTSPYALVKDSIQSLLYPTTKANPKLDEVFYESISLDKVKEQFQNHLGNPSVFTYCLIGDIPEDEAETLICKYVASLPSKTKFNDEVQSLDFSNPASSIVKTFVLEDEEDKAEVSLAYQLPGRLSDKEQKVLPLLESLLQNRLFEELRERQNATYGVDVEAKQYLYPVAYTNVGIHFITQTTKVKTLKKFTETILNEICEGKIDTSLFKRIQIPFILEEQQNKTVEEDDEEDQLAAMDPLMWLALLENYVSPNEELTAKSNYETEDIKLKDIQALAQKIRGKGKIRDFLIVTHPKQNRLH